MRSHLIPFQFQKWNHRDYRNLYQHLLAFLLPKVAQFSLAIFKNMSYLININNRDNNNSYLLSKVPYSTLAIRSEYK